MNREDRFHLDEIEYILFKKMKHREHSIGVNKIHLIS
jgi:hypothetical protein